MLFVHITSLQKEFYKQWSTAHAFLQTPVQQRIPKDSSMMNKIYKPFPFHIPDRDKQLQ